MVRGREHGVMVKDFRILSTRQIALLLLFALSIGCGDGKPAVAPTPEPAPKIREAMQAGRYAGKNVVIVSVDTLRADHLGIYGYERNTSPRLDAIASQAITFERGRAPRGLTWPSLVSIFTGLYPQSSNVRQNGDLLSDDVPTLASLLEAAGYATANFRGNACGLFTRNFDTNFCGTDEEVHQAAIQWVNDRDESPFFLWVHYRAPHEEYLPPKQYDHFTSPDYAGEATGKRDYLDPVMISKRRPEPEDVARVINLYDGEVLYSDAMFGEVVDALDERGLLDDSIVVFTSDHGEELLQHNNYYYHSCSVYDAVLHIPLVMRLPDANFGGDRVSQLVENINITPTLLDLVGIEPPSDLEGRSMRPLINQEPDAARSFTQATAEYHRPGTGWVGTIRTDEWHYIYNPDRITTLCRPQSDYFTLRAEELYNHSRDPLEEYDVAIENPELVAELRRELLDSIARQREAREPDRADEQVIEQLKAMGYLID